MITRCRNCANQLVFDPGTQKLVCDRCGSSFKPEDFNISGDDPVWDKKPTSMNEILGKDLRLNIAGIAGKHGGSDRGRF